MRKMAGAILALAVAGCGGGGGHREGRWESLGSRMVDFGGDHDSIMAVHQGVFTKIKLEVSGGDLLMHNVVVHFGNGEKYSPDTRFEFNSNTGSRVIDLPGEARKIVRIEFRYKSIRGGRGGRATITAWGRHN